MSDEADQPQQLARNDVIQSVASSESAFSVVIFNNSDCADWIDGWMDTRPGEGLPRMFRKKPGCVTGALVRIEVTSSGGPVDPCDFDADGTFGLGDVELLRAEVMAGTNNATFDLTGDGVVNVDDIKYFIEDESKLHTWMGDANLDGEFNSTDFVEVSFFGIGGLSAIRRRR